MSSEDKVCMPGDKKFILCTIVCCLHSKADFGHTQNLKEEKLNEKDGQQQEVVVVDVGGGVDVTK